MLKKFSQFFLLFFYRTYAFGRTGYGCNRQYREQRSKGRWQGRNIGQDRAWSNLYLVICSEKIFKPGDSIGSKEKAQLSKLFGDTAIPPVYYVITNSPGNLATPKVVSKGRWFPPFKWDMEVNKTKNGGRYLKT